jgi:hypothetical protein
VFFQLRLGAFHFYVQVGSELIAHAIAGTRTGFSEFDPLSLEGGFETSASKAAHVVLHLLILKLCSSWLIRRNNAAARKDTSLFARLIRKPVFHWHSA